jgi:tryptophanyl-tRNA synthetase
MKVAVISDLHANREALDAVLAKGALKAREIAVPTLDAAYQALGLVRAAR